MSNSKNLTQHVIHATHAHNIARSPPRPPSSIDQSSLASHTCASETMFFTHTRAHITYTHTRALIHTVHGTLSINETCSTSMQDAFGSQHVRPACSSLLYHCGISWCRSRHSQYSGSKRAFRQISILGCLVSDRGSPLAPPACRCPGSAACHSSPCRSQAAGQMQSAAWPPSEASASPL